jgi:TIR domain
MPEIFLSYHRQDTDHELSLYMWLIKRYGREAVFWDQKNIDAGRDFAEILNRGIKKSVAFIALIEAEWLAADTAGSIPPMIGSGAKQAPHSIAGCW